MAEYDSGRVLVIENAWPFLANIRANAGLFVPAHRTACPTRQANSNAYLQTTLVWLRPEESKVGPGGALGCGA